MIEILIFFIGASLLLYVVFGGADYGAGVLELLPVSAELREKQTKTVNDAMGPVWEANHIWLILIVVILFIGFPDIFITLMTALHIPMVALLLGIVVRGCAFTFRHYDPEYEETSQRVYTLIFGASSLWTSIWLGIIVASLNRGLIRDDATTFFDAYIAPWIGLFPILMGIFVLLIFSFLAAVYLIGETRDKALRATFVRRAYLLNILLIIQGALVFAASLREREGLLFQLITRPATAIPIVLATLCFLALWFLIERHQTFLLRFAAAGQVALILLGWVVMYAPNALVTTSGPISFYAVAAPEPVLRQLILALLVGSLFIFPSLFYLLKVFKVDRPADMVNSDQYGKASQK